MTNGLSLLIARKERSGGTAHIVWRAARLEGFAAAFREEEHGGCRYQERGGEERKEQRGSTECDQRRHNERRRDGGDTADAGGGTGSGSAKVGREDFRAQGVEGAPRAEVEEGEHATCEDNEYLGVRHAVASCRQCGAEQEGCQGCASAPLFDEVGGDRVAGQLGEGHDEREREGLHEAEALGVQ